MADVNNNTHIGADEDLRGQDREKNTSILAQITGKDKKTSKKSGAETYRRSKKSQKKKWHAVVDIVVAILMIAIIGGLMVGGYYIFRYFSDDYETVEVTYTFVVSEDALAEAGVQSAKGMAGRAVYCDSDGNTHYFGKIKSAEISADGSLIISVDVTAKYRSEEGHLIDGISLAVGLNYALRTEYNAMNGTVVRLDNKK